MIKIDLRPEHRVLRQFAWVALVGLPLIAAIVLRWMDAFSWTHVALLTVAAVAVLQLVLFELVTDLLTRPLYVVISLVAMPIGFVLSHVLMMVVYYLVITPIALVFRLTGRDVLGMRIEKARPTYWHDRKHARPAASYFKLY